MWARQALITAMHGRAAARNAVERSARRKVRRVLVVRPDHLGDLLFATPALELLRQAFPDAFITGVVGPWGKAMWAGNPDLNALATVPFPGMRLGGQGWPLAPYLLIGSAARRIAKDRYDLGIVLRSDHWWGAAMLWAAGVPRRWGYNTPGMAQWLTDTVPYTEGRHEVEQDLFLVEALTRELGDVWVKHAPALRISREEGIPRLRPPRSSPPNPDLVRGWLDAGRRVVIHPGTAASNKLWTIEGWAATARWLANDGWSVALTGSPDEKPLADAIAGAYEAGGTPTGPSLLNLAGQTASLPELVWVLERAHMVLGVDSGPLHIASALHKPTLHLYGPSDEAVWGPWGNPEAHRAFRAPGIKPTGKLDVGSPGLEGGPEMRAIAVDMVMEEVRRLSALAGAREGGKA